MGDKKGLFSMRGRKSLWATNFMTIVILAIFLLVVFGIESLIKPQFTLTTLIITGVILALIPAVIWIIFFYRQDRLEPEPKGLVIEVFILGGLLASAVGIPLLNLYNLPNWLFGSLGINFLGAILVVGFSQEFLKFAAVRFSMYNSAEFDERIDGIIYATSAGLGFATVLNVMYIISSGGASLGMGAIRVVVTALAQASFAGITGYFLGKEKLDGKPAWWLPLGILIAAGLNGVFFTLWGTLSQGSININGGFVNPWVGLVLAVVIALTTTFILSWLMERDIKKELQSVSSETTNGMNAATDIKSFRRNQPTLSAIIVTVMALVFLSLGWMVKNSIENQTQLVERAGVQAYMPAGWRVGTGLADEQFVFSASDPFDPNQSISVNLMPASANMVVSDLVINRNLERGQKMSGYKVLDQSSGKSNGKEIYKVHFAYVQPGNKDQVPTVIEGMDYYFLSQPKSMVVTMEEETSLFKKALPRFDDTLAKISFTPGGK